MNALDNYIQEQAGHFGVNTHNQMVINFNGMKM